MALFHSETRSYMIKDFISVIKTCSCLGFIHIYQTGPNRDKIISAPAASHVSDIYKGLAIAGP